MSNDTDDFLQTSRHMLERRKVAATLQVSRDASRLAGSLHG